MAAGQYSSSLVVQALTKEDPTTVPSNLDEQMKSTHAHLATAILKVIDRVAAFSPRGTLNAMMRVSQLWNLAVLPHLWGKLDSLLPLVEVAGPLIWRQEQGWASTLDFRRDLRLTIIQKAFRRVPSTEGWVRFEKYVKRVKYVKHSDNSAYKMNTSLISPTVFLVDLPLHQTTTSSHTALLLNLVMFHGVPASEATLTYLPAILSAATEKVTLLASGSPIPSFAVAGAFQ